MNQADQNANKSQQNIKVCIRMRPLFLRERQGNWMINQGNNSIKLDQQQENNKIQEDPILKYMQGSKRQMGQVQQEQLIDGQKTSKSTFYFDQIYDQSQVNQDIYKGQCQPIIKRVLDGYNGTIFCYGQTTAGKTHTMIGNREEKGILQQSIIDIFDYIEQVKEDRDIRFWASYMEIYNENINDLLDQNNSQLKVREDQSEGYFVSGLKTLRLYSFDDLQKMLTLGERSRHYRQTDIHEKSSRSHTIFRIVIENRLQESKKLIQEDEFNIQDDKKYYHLSYGTKYSILNLVDLAGSERLTESGVHSIEETQHINSSLFTLTNVIYKLSMQNEKTIHIPYRESKLTMILQSALGGNSLTSIICNISPHQEHVNLTVSTLRFASRAKQIKVNAQLNEIINDYELLQGYKRKIIILEKRINELELLVQNQSVNIQNKQNVLKVNQIESLMNDLQFELNQLRIDNNNLSDNAHREKQTCDIFRTLYNNLLAKQMVDNETQTEEIQNIDHFFIYNKIIELIKNENNLQNQKINKQKYSEIVDQYFEFINNVKEKILEVNLRSKQQPIYEEYSPENVYKNNEKKYLQLKKCNLSDYQSINKIMENTEQLQPNNLYFQTQKLNKEIQYQEALQFVQEQKQRLLEQNENSQSQSNYLSVDQNQRSSSSMNYRSQNNSASKNKEQIQDVKIFRNTQKSFLNNQNNNKQLQSLNQSNKGNKIQQNIKNSKIIIREQNRYNSKSPQMKKNQKQLNLDEKQPQNQAQQTQNTTQQSQNQKNSTVESLSQLQNNEMTNQDSQILTNNQQKIDIQQQQYKLQASQNQQQNDQIWNKQNKNMIQQQPQPIKQDQKIKKQKLLDEVEEEFQDMEFDFRSEEELEDLMSEDSDMSIDSQPEDLNRKFNLHRKIKDLLETDLLQTQSSNVKQGVNTFIFGDNRFGKCGVGKQDLLIKEPQNIFVNFKNVFCGYHHNIAIDKNKIMYSWGRNTYGQLGQGKNADINTSIPNLVRGPLWKVKMGMISCGWQHSLATTINGFLFAWGLNISGQLGLSDFVDRFEPQQVKSLSEYQITSISAGFLHSGAVTNTGKLYMWGQNPDCRLLKQLKYYPKSGRPKNYCSPQKIKQFQDISQVSCGTSHTLILDLEGNVFSSGSPDHGQLGINPYDFNPKQCDKPYTEVQTFFKGNKAISVHAGDGFSLFLDQFGSVYTCGKANFGRLGQGHLVSISKPSKIDYFKKHNLKIKQVAVGGRHCLALSDDNQLFAWGFGFYYQFGRAEDQEDHLTPIKLEVKSEKRVKKISCGYFHSSYIVK